jgi:hypothetical protein
MHLGFATGVEAPFGLVSDVIESQEGKRATALIIVQCLLGPVHPALSLDSSCAIPSLSPGLPVPWNGKGSGLLLLPV